MQEQSKQFRRLLPFGAMKRIAAEVGMSRQAVSTALIEMKPTHPAVLAALRIIRESGSAEVEKELTQVLSSSAIS